MVITGVWKIMGPLDSARHVVIYLPRSPPICSAGLVNSMSVMILNKGLILDL